MILKRGYVNQKRSHSAAERFCHILYQKIVSFQFPEPKWKGKAWVQLMCFRNIWMFFLSLCWSCCGGSFCFGRISRLIVASVFTGLRRTFGDDTQPWVELFQALRIVCNGNDFPLIFNFIFWFVNYILVDLSLPLDI